MCGRELAALTHHPAVDDHQDVAAIDEWVGIRCCPGSAGQLVGERVLQCDQVVGDGETGQIRWWDGRIGQVRRPLQPVPGGQPVAPRAQRQPELGRGMPGDGLHDHRCCHPPTGSRIAFQPDPGERSQRQGDRQLADRAMGSQEPAQRYRGDDVDVFQRLGLAQLKIQRQCLVPEAEPDGREVRVGGSSLPESAGPDQRLQPVRIGVQPVQRLGLICCSRAGLAADLREVAEIVAPLTGDPPGAIAADPGQLPTRHGEGGNAEHHAGRNVRTGTTGREDQSHGAEPTQRGQDHQPGGDSAGLALRQGRRRVNLDLPDDQRRRFAARRAPERHNRHAAPARRSRRVLASAVLTHKCRSVTLAGQLNDATMRRCASM